MDINNVKNHEIFTGINTSFDNIFDIGTVINLEKARPYLTTEHPTPY